MPKGPQGQQRPADAIGYVVRVAQIATGEVEESLITKSGFVRSGHAGAKARTESLTIEERQNIAKKSGGKMEIGKKIMTDIQESADIEIIFATNGDGQFVAASASSPYFCFQGASEAEVRASVDAAIATYINHKSKVPVVSPPRTISITTLSPDRIEERSLAVA